jgi:hypothetical protein
MSEHGHRLVVRSDALPERVAELAAWYQEIHVPEIVELGAVAGATLLEWAGRDDPQAPATGFVVVYDVHEGLIAEAKHQLAQLRAERRNPVSKALAPGAHGHWYAVRSRHV